LRGVISIRQLLLAKPNSTLREVMNPRIITVATDTDREIVAQLVDKYRLLAIPVVDESGSLAGMVTVDDVFEVLESETTEDMLRMAGTDKSEILTHSALRVAWIRLPWLLAAFIGGLAATGIIRIFEGVLMEVIALGAFLPVVMGMAGNVGVQTATVTVRGLATGSLNLHDVWSVLHKELRVGLLLGLFYGAGLGIYGWFMFGDMSLAGVVGLTIFGNMTGAALLAVSLPMIFQRLGTDPAIATGPFVTTAIDVFGVLNYFVIATALLDLPGGV
jgi:magnesium transporter